MKKAAAKKKVAKVMREFKKGELNIGKSSKKVKAKTGKTRIATPSQSRSPFVAQGNQGETFDKIMQQKYDWWK